LRSLGELQTKKIGLSSKTSNSNLKQELKAKGGKMEQMIVELIAAE